jgi:hypothetical protein
MAATTNGAGIARLVRGTRTFEDAGNAMRYAQSNFLDELPGVTFALITLTYVVTSLYALL